MKSLFPVYILLGLTGYFHSPVYAGHPGKPVRPELRKHEDIPLSQRLYTEYAAKFDSLIALNRAGLITDKFQPDTLCSPYLWPILLPQVLSDQSINKGMEGMYSQSTFQAQMSARAKNAPYFDGTDANPALYSSAAVYAMAESAQKQAIEACVEYPWAVTLDTRRGGKVDDSRLHPQPLPKSEIKLTGQGKEPEKPAKIGNDVLAGEDDLGIVVRKPNFWNYRANFSFQFTQNYVSDNWHKGGESNNALLATAVLEANFNNQQKVKFDNKLEMKLGFQSSENDKEHKFKTNSDLLRLTNKLGLSAVKHWYYTVMLQSWTQFYPGYKSNDKKVYSDFMSPFESLLSIGMDYQQASKNNKFKVNATLSPLALKFKYVGRPSLTHDFGLKGDHHARWEYGSNITVNFDWDVIKNVHWHSRIYYFTDYSKTQLEWENTFNLSINKYLSAKLFLYPRFDDSRSRKEGQSNFEFSELLSMGLNLNF